MTRFVSGVLVGRTSSRPSAQAWTWVATVGQRAIKPLYTNFMQVPLPGYECQHEHSCGAQDGQDDLPPQRQVEYIRGLHTLQGRVP